MRLVRKRCGSGRQPQVEGDALLADALAQVARRDAVAMHRQLSVLERKAGIAATMDGVWDKGRAG